MKAVVINTESGEVVRSINGYVDPDSQVVGDDERLITDEEMDIPNGQPNSFKYDVENDEFVDVETPAKKRQKRHERKKSKAKENVLSNNPNKAVRQLYELVTGEEIDTKGKGNN